MPKKEQDHRYSLVSQPDPHILKIARCLRCDVEKKSCTDAALAKFPLGTRLDIEVSTSSTSDADMTVPHGGLLVRVLSVLNTRFFMMAIDQRDGLT